MATDTTYVPAGFGPVETERLIDSTGLEYTVDKVNLQHLAGQV